MERGERHPTPEPSNPGDPGTGDPHQGLPFVESDLLSALLHLHDELTGSEPTKARLEELVTRRSSSRYVSRGEIGRGGMGAILKVFDQDLRRQLAMKVIADAKQAATGPALSRFLDEAQITGQLNHPGVVPVHELGIDSAGSVYFTMQLVRGEDLKAVFGRVAAGDPDWTRERVLGVLLKVCEAMAYAHDHGVIHRDLKPANVMVGRYGEVFVMDWGLARVEGREDSRDLRPRAREETRSEIRTDRGDARDTDHDSPIFTMDGAVLGTPAFMAPEQARGQSETVGPRSDVYSVGAMLYALLCGQVPYVESGARISARTVLARVIDGPPRSLREFDTTLPEELIAICERAMAREPSARYETMGDLAHDLRAYLEGRVVRAYRTGALAEAVTWVRRNRALAAALIGLVALTVLGSLRVASVEAARNRDLLRLSAQQEFDDLKRWQASLWPATADLADEYESWIRRAQKLIAQQDRAIDGGPGNRRVLAVLSARLGPSTDSAEPSFESLSDRWWRNRLEHLVADVDGLAEPDRGPLHGFAPEFGWGVSRRLDFVRKIDQAFEPGEEFASRWESFNETRVGRAEPPLAPIWGLVPIGRDPDSGRPEFWHVASGSEPLRDAHGRIHVGPETGLVFVLVPAGPLQLGTQSTDETRARYVPDGWRAPAEFEPAETFVDAFLISKFELTQGQWYRLCADHPSRYGESGLKPRHSRGGSVDPLTHPVEQVSWQDASEVLPRFGLRLPDELEWEHAARAGSPHEWWTGRERTSMSGVFNVADACAADYSGFPHPTDPDLEDGWVVHAPVDLGVGNGFGLFGVLGNVWELCGNRFGAGVESTQDDPELPDGSCTIRGGSFLDLPSKARLSFRTSRSILEGASDLGLRPAMDLP